MVELKSSASPSTHPKQERWKMLTDMVMTDRARRLGCGVFGCRIRHVCDGKAAMVVRQTVMRPASGSEEAPNIQNDWPWHAAEVDASKPTSTMLYFDIEGY